MILADTSVWIDYARKGDTQVETLARDGLMCSHSFVSGEMAVGSLHLHNRMLLMIRNLPRIATVSEGEFYAFIEANAVNGKGLGFVDMHLLAAASRTTDTVIWTRDRRLLEQADRLNLAYRP